MPRTATPRPHATASGPRAVDVFDAVADPRRRQLLELLRRGEAPVGDLVAGLQLPQPQVSKHLKVLREAGVVRCRAVGRQRRYRIDGAALRNVGDWIASFEALWNERYDRLDDYLHELSAPQAGTDQPPPDTEERS